MSGLINQMEISSALIYTQTHTIDTQGLSELSLILEFIGMSNKSGEAQYPYILKIKSK